MAMPSDAPSFPAGISLNLSSGIILPSTGLKALLVKAREDYDWPFNTGKSLSQQRIIDLENQVDTLLKGLTESAAHQIICLVSCWAGNNKVSHTKIMNASGLEKKVMLNAIQVCTAPGYGRAGIDALCQLPGVRLVIASKIYRFCKPKEGAAVDRHASYFFNSLAITGLGTAFVREWSSKSRTGSRLATYTPSRYQRNLNEYIQNYLPILAEIAKALNQAKQGFRCAATGKINDWTAADVEMAAYYWWARNGAR